MTALEQFIKGKSFLYAIVLLMVVISGIALISNVFFSQALSVPLVIALGVFSSLGIILGILILARRPTAARMGSIFYFVQIVAVDSRYFGFDFYTSGTVGLNISFNFGVSTLSIDLVALFMYISLRKMTQPMALESDTEKPSEENKEDVESVLAEERGEDDENTQLVYPQSLIRRSLLLYKPSRPWNWIKYRLPFYFLVFIAIPAFSLLALFIFVGPENTSEGIPEVIFLVIIALFLRDLETSSDKKRRPRVGKQNRIEN